MYQSGPHHGRLQQAHFEAEEVVEAAEVIVETADEETVETTDTAEEAEAAQVEPELAMELLVRN